MTHSVMMQFHNTQLPSPTARGRDERQPLGPQQLASFAARLEPLTPRPAPTPFSIEGAEREERRVNRKIEREGGRRRSLEQTSR